MRSQRVIAGVLAAMTASSVLLGEHIVCGEPATNGEAVFRQIDADADGRVTMDEATFGNRALLERVFKAAGKESTDSLTRDEFLAAYQRARAKAAPSSSSKSSSSGSSNSESESSSAESKSGPLKFADADGDGKISRAEWSKFKQAFSHLDADKNNALDASELPAAGGSAELLMKLADANGDEKISRIEWGKLVQGFARLDANRDSSLDEDELQKVADAATASASGSASLSGSSGKSGAKSTGPTLWRGRIEGRGQIELLVNGNQVVGREIGGGGGGPPGGGRGPGPGGPGGPPGPGGMGPGGPGGPGGGGGDSLGSGTITMSGDGKSGNMDAVYTEGQHAGEECLGIYKLEGDTLLWCVNNRGGRPQSFSGGGGNWLLTLTRVPPESSGTSK